MSEQYSGINARRSARKKAGTGKPSKAKLRKESDATQASGATPF